MLKRRRGKRKRLQLFRYTPGILRRGCEWQEDRRGKEKDKINFNRFLFVGFKLLKLLLRDIRGPWVVMGPWGYLLRVSYWPTLVSGLQYLIILTADNHAACFTWSHPTGRGSQAPTSFLQPLFGSILGRNFALSCELTGARSQTNTLTWELTLF